MALPPYLSEADGATLVRDKLVRLPGLNPALAAVRLR